MAQNTGGQARFLCAPLIAVLTLALVAPGLAAKERRGASIRVLKKDGAIIEGELLAVKGDDLIILNQATSREVSESLLEIKTIKIVRKSEKTGWAIVVGVASAVICAASAPAQGEEGRDWLGIKPGPVSYGILGGLAGIGSGLLYASERQHISLKKAGPEDIGKIRARLRKRARDQS